MKELLRVLQIWVCLVAVSFGILAVANGIGPFNTPDQGASDFNQLDVTK